MLLANNNSISTKIRFLIHQQMPGNHIGTHKKKLKHQRINYHKKKYLKSKTFLFSMEI